MSTKDASKLGAGRGLGPGTSRAARVGRWAIGKWGLATLLVVGATQVAPAEAREGRPAAARGGGVMGGGRKASRPSSARAPVEKASLRRPVDPSWCAPETERLSDGVCYIDGRKSESGRRTLVIFLHGAIAEHTDWQWTQERALVRQAKASGFQAIFPRSPLGPGGYTWPGKLAKIEEQESAIVEEWTRARRTLEARDGRPFDEVFVMGFSSGAYYVGSLALRGRLDVDGYAVFAGGSSRHGPVVNAERRVPVFVGVCAKDKHTAPHARGFSVTLGGRGIPHRTDEQPIGHMFGDVHVAHAVAYLRSQVRARAQ